jgi:hypothetical protein
VPMTHYRRMADQQAIAALEEFLTERAPALEALHAALRTEGMDPEVVLDAPPPESLTRLWAWITESPPLRRRLPRSPPWWDSTGPWHRCGVPSLRPRSRWCTPAGALLLPWWPLTAPAASRTSARGTDPQVPSPVAPRRASISA